MPKLIDYDDFQRDVQRRKRERWAKILAAEPPGRAPGRRPRDPEKERLLPRLDRLRLERSRRAQTVVEPGARTAPSRTASRRSRTCSRRSGRRSGPTVRGQKRGVMRSMRTVQMTLDRALVEAVDDAARSLGTTRSAFARKALTDALERMRVEALEKRHRRGYERHPVRPDEFSGWEQEQA